MKNNLLLKRVALYGGAILTAGVLLVIVSVDLATRSEGQQLLPSILKREPIDNISQGLQGQRWQIDVMKKQFAELRSLLGVFVEHFPQEEGSSSQPVGSTTAEAEEESGRSRDKEQGK